MTDGNLLSQLKRRRVFRAGLIYVAVVWVVLQVADLLAGAGIIREQFVRWLILAAVLGFPATLIASWFLDSPWRGGKWNALGGDIVIIAGITLAAALFVRQQWFTSFARPTAEVRVIEATDMRDDTRVLADRFGSRLRTLLAMRPEMRVPEFGAASSNADYRVSGTLAQGGISLRLTLQLRDSEGEVIWGETFESKSVDRRVVFRRAVSAVFQQLPLPSEAVAEVQALIDACQDFDNRDALVDLSRQYLDKLEALPATKRSVAHQLALHQLQEAEDLCPGWPDAELLRLEHTLELQNENLNEVRLLSRFPNSALIHLRLAERLELAGRSDEADELFAEACRLQPALALPQCD